MKKLFTVLSLFVFFTLSVFAQYEAFSSPEVKIVRVTPYNIQSTLSVLKAGPDYKIIFSDNFDMNLVSENYRKYGLIRDLRRLFTGTYGDAQAQVQIEGPVEYIYYNGHHSVSELTEVLKKIAQAKDKMVCVDLADSYYRESSDKQPMSFPKNFLSNLDNLYWIYLGPMDQVPVSENFARDCKNLQAVFVWEETRFLRGALENVNPKAVIVNKMGNVYSLSYYLDNWNYVHYGEYWDAQKFQVLPEKNEIEISENSIPVKRPLVQDKEISETSELNLKSSEIPFTTEKVVPQEKVFTTEKTIPEDSEPFVFEYHPAVKACSDGVTWTIDWRGRFQPQQKAAKTNDFGIYDIVNNEDFVYEPEAEEKIREKIHLLTRNNPDIVEFEIIENSFILNKENFEKYDNSRVRKTEPVEVAKAFLASYILKTENYLKLTGYAEDAAEPFEVSLDPANSAKLWDYKDLTLYIYTDFDKTSGDGPLMVGIEGRLNGRIIQDVLILRLKRTGSNWSVINIFDGWLYYSSTTNSN